MKRHHCISDARMPKARYRKPRGLFYYLQLLRPCLLGWLVMNSQCAGRIVREFFCWRAPASALLNGAYRAAMFSCCSSASQSNNQDLNLDSLIFFVDGQLERIQQIGFCSLVGQARFEYADTDRDGSLNLLEFCELLSEMKLGLDNDSIIEQLGSMQSHSITWSQALNFLQPQAGLQLAEADCNQVPSSIKAALSTCSVKGFSACSTTMGMGSLTSWNSWRCFFQIAMTMTFRT